MSRIRPTGPLLPALRLAAALSLSAAVTASAMLTMTAGSATAEPGNTITQAVVVDMGPAGFSRGGM